MIKAQDISVQRHAVDGFTLYALDRDGVLVNRRFIGYTLQEAKRLFMQEVNA